MKKVVTIGSAVIDVILKSSKFKVVKGHDVPGGIALCEVMGGKQEAQEGVLETGGAGTNVSVGLRRLGESVKVITRVGNDDLSELILNRLKQENINIDMVQKGKGNTGLSAVLVASDGGRSIITYRGESGEIDGKQLDWNVLAGTDWIQVSSLGGQIDLLEDIVAFANEKRIGIGVNPGKRELEEKDRLKKLIPKINLFNVNRMEASSLWGVDFDDEKKMIEEFIRAKSPLVVITDGRRGASLCTGSRWIKMEAYPERSVDDTGAGDGFVSGMVAGILQERGLEDSLKMGLANGGSVVTKIGAKAGLLFENQIEKKL